MRGRGRRVVLSALVILSVGVAVIIVATRYYPAYRDAIVARDELRSAQTLLGERGLDVTASELVAAETQLGEAERRFVDARGRFDDRFLQMGQAIPWVGGWPAAAVDLSDIGADGARLGQDAVAATRAYQRWRDQDSESLTGRIPAMLAQMEPSMTAIREGLAKIEGPRARLADSSLPGLPVEAIQELDEDMAELEELVGTYEHLSVLLPDFLGFNGPRTYLLLAQNNAELLPTGGLISVLGVITVEDGQILDKRFEDAIDFGTRWLARTGDHVEPPRPLAQYLLRETSWNLSLSNWSPHFPTAATEAERFYRLGGGQPVDGVIAINVRTIEELLRVTGPIAVESYGVTVTAENALEMIEEHTRTAQDPETDRKAFVGLVADELLPRLIDTPSEQWTSLVESMERLRDQRQILLFLHQDDLGDAADGLGLAGALETPDGDYFMLVDASVNSTKLNVVLDQRIDLTVRIDAAGAAWHQARVSYFNDLPAWSQGRDPTLVRRLMLDGLYGGYVRLLAPEGAELESVTLAGREAGVEEIGVEQGKAVFGRFFALPSGEEEELAFRYVTPSAAQSEDNVYVYRL